MEKIYISSKISGLDHKEVQDVFRAVKNDLKNKGCLVVSPTETNGFMCRKSWEKCMKECIRRLCKCDKIYMFGDWRNSKGAVIELFLAMLLGLEVIYADGSKGLTVKGCCLRLIANFL